MLLKIISKSPDLNFLSRVIHKKNELYNKVDHWDIKQEES